MTNTPKKTRQRPGWERLAAGTAGVWRHIASGWTVRHCGHPTALWPYAGYAPAGSGVKELLLTGGLGLGRGFARLADAQAAVEMEVARTR